MFLEILRLFKGLLQYENGGFDKEAEGLKNLILSAKDCHRIHGRVYYISENGNDSNDGISVKSPWKTTEAIVKNYDNFNFGDTVLFERGGVYRLNSRISVKSGISFGAYGEGNKPKILGSLTNFAKEEMWKSSDIDGIWSMVFDYGNVGNIIFENDLAVGIKKFSVDELTDNGDFYHDLSTNILYLKCSVGNPGAYFKNIEIAHFGNMFFVEDYATDISFDNLCIKYGGSHGIGTRGHNKNINVTNCEIAFIGGSQQNPEKLGNLRYGNGIQFWAEAQDCIIENNWLYQIYDAALTFQGGGEISHYKNLSFSNNLVEYSTYSFEFFDRDLESKIFDVRICNNIMRFAGYGWGKQRPDKYGTSHLTGWVHMYKNMTSMYFCNNLYDSSDYNFVYWYWNEDFNHDNLIVSNNSYYQKKNDRNYSLKFVLDNQLTASNREEFLKTITEFDKTPKSVVFEE